jgi:hypothetical protein
MDLLYLSRNSLHIEEDLFHPVYFHSDQSEEFIWMPWSLAITFEEKE